LERRLGEFEARLDQLARELGEVRQRLRALEGDARTAPPSAVASDRISGEVPREASGVRTPASLVSARAIALAGRTLVVLGGAYLLRAISEAALIPAPAGAAISLAYATGWLLQADRSASRGERLSAVFHGFAAVMIAYPLIFETTARFEILSPPVSAATLVCFAALGLAVAWRRSLWEVACLFAFLGPATALGLVVGTHAFQFFVIALLLMALPVELLAFRDRWLGLRLPAAVGLDLGVLMLFSAALRPDAPSEGYTAVSPAGAIGVGLALPVLYLGSIAARTLLRERLITPFEVVQATAALLVGVGGAVRVIAFGGAEPTAVGGAILVLGAACYAAAFASIDRRSGRGGNFYAYTTFAGLLVLVGSWMVLDGMLLVVGWSVLAVAALVLGGRFDRITLKFHGSLYLAAVVSVAGLVACASDGLLADAAGPWRPLTPVGAALTAVVAACYGILVGTRRTAPSGWVDLLPRAIVGALLVWCVAGVASGRLAGPLARALGASGAVDGAASLAASRTMVLALLAVGLAWAGRRWVLQELTWLVYPLLIGGGVKLLLEDFRHGEPVTLFLGLALYGGALIVTPRLMRRDG